jgi:hypothetical protein
MPRIQMYLNTYKCGHKRMEPGLQTSPPAERNCPKCVDKASTSTANK